MMSLSTLVRSKLMTPPASSPTGRYTLEENAPLVPAQFEGERTIVTVRAEAGAIEITNGRLIHVAGGETRSIPWTEIVGYESPSKLATTDDAREVKISVRPNLVIVRANGERVTLTAPVESSGYLFVLASIIQWMLLVTKGRPDRWRELGVVGPGS